MPVTPGFFYNEPADLSSTQPGDIIRSELITDFVPNDAVVWRVLYHSTDQNGEPIAVSGVVVAPEGEATEPRPILAWAHGTLGVVPGCGTSHTALALLLIPEISKLIDEGFVIAATDYPGLGTPGIHPYLFGEVEAAAVLDAVRAARNLDVGAGNRFAAWGHSQGGHAALWTGIQAPEYAPELELVGVAAIAPAIDLPGIVQFNLDRPEGILLLSMGLYAWSFLVDGIDLDVVITPDQRENIERMGQLCLTTPGAFIGQDAMPAPREIITVDPAVTEPFPTFLAENVPDGPIDTPILITHGTADTTIPFEGSRNAAQARCDAGENIQLARFPGSTHLTVLNASSGYVLGWTLDRFDGLPQNTTCAR